MASPHVGMSAHLFRCHSRRGRTAVPVLLPGWSRGFFDRAGDVDAQAGDQGWSPGGAEPAVWAVAVGSDDVEARVRRRVRVPEPEGSGRRAVRAQVLQPLDRLLEGGYVAGPDPPHHLERRLRQLEPLGAAPEHVQVAAAVDVVPQALATLPDR